MIAKNSKHSYNKKLIISILLCTFVFSGIAYITSLQKKSPVFLSNPKKNWNPTKRWEPVTVTNIQAKINNTDDVDPLLTDVRAYFAKIKKTDFKISEPFLIDDYSLLKKMESFDKNLVVIDVREKREQEKLIRLSNYSNIKYIRFGDLINDNFDSIPKDAEVVIIGFTENREIVASSYLISQGYSNVKILEGGLLQWSLDNLPAKINEYKRFKDKYVQKLGIYSVLKELKNKDIQNHSPSPVILKFGAYKQNSITLPIMDTKALSNFIHSLPPNKEYILSCNSIKYCWEASYFWYVAKQTINIIGYIRN